jgi:hypothetical protein
MTKDERIVRPARPAAPEDFSDAAEVARYFAARGSRTTPQRAKAVLNRLGTAGVARDDDRLDAE